MSEMSASDRLLVYQDRKANPTTVWLLYLFLGWSYGSLGEIGLQLLYYFTLGGCGIWTIIRLFTLQGAIERYNSELAKELGIDLPSVLR